MKINNLLDKIDSTERKEESVLASIANSLSRKDKKVSERPMRMINMLNKVIEGTDISKEANEIIREVLEEIEERIFMKKEGLSAGYFPGIQTNILMFKFLTELKNLHTSSAYVIKELLEKKKQEVVAGSWFMIESGTIVMYPSGKTTLIEWTQKTGYTLNENRFFLRAKLLKENKLEDKAMRAIKDSIIITDIKQFYEF